jgi:superkiller protein 3
LIAVHTFIIDPDYASAHAGLAMATMFPSNSPEEQARAAFHVERAMVLDPTLAEAHVATGRLLWNQLKLEEALTAFRRAVQINPNFAIVCTNNPYEAVWQPAEETCDDG